MELRAKVIDEFAQFLNYFSLKKLATINFEEMYKKEEQVLYWGETESPQIAIQRKFYILLKYRTVLVWKFLEAWRANFAPGQGSSAVDIQVIELLSDLHLYFLEELEKEARAHGLIWKKPCCSKIFEGSPRDRGAIIARNNTHTPSRCCIRTMLYVNGKWVVEPCADRWVKIPRMVISNEVPHQRQYDDTLPTVSVFFRLMTKRWADVCLAVVEFCASQRLLPAGSLQFCRSLQLVEPVSRIHPSRSPVFAFRVSQFCSIFVDFSLFNWIPSADISEFLSSVALDRTVLRSVQSSQNSFSVTPSVQLSLDQHQSSSSSTDSSSSLHFDQTDFDATTIRMNWAKFLFSILKKMVTPGSKQAKGFAIQISILLASIPTLELGESSEFPASKILSKKTVHRFVSINDRDGAEEVTGAAKKRAVSKKRPAADVGATVTKKKRTIKKKSVSSLSTLEMVAVAQEAVPLQQVLDETRAVDAPADKAQPVVTEEKLWYDLPYEDLVAKWEAEQPVVTASDTDEEIATMDVAPADGDQQVQESLAPISTDDMLSADEQMSLDDIILTIPVDIPLPSSSMEITKIMMGKTIKIPGVTKWTWFLKNLPRIPTDDKGKEILVEKDPIRGNPAREHFFLICADIDLLVELRAKVIDEVAQFLNSFSLKKLATINFEEMYKKEEQVLYWGETESPQVAIQRKYYILLKYRQVLVWKFLEAWRDNFAPGQGSSAVDIQLRMLLSFADVRQEVQAVNAKVDIMTSRLNDIQKDAEATKEALSHQLLEFQSSAQENHSVLHAQLSELVDYIHRGGADKKGESGSRGLQQPSNVQVSASAERTPTFAQRVEMAQRHIVHTVLDVDANRALFERQDAAERDRERRRREARALKRRRRD
ncbi:RNA helicase family protein isoform 1 [Dorcoceras hygrometricum]|uniref:RNA helicase family protein isoform 1 n=1 Tax=Dorcoceras hygrometricum TaxID=472368 RepID=A0A2Z7D9V5_9LAMI|nr:RNA helicase family protein isoform 1 [Dorcoceras hygrometricum]